MGIAKTLNELSVQLEVQKKYFQEEMQKQFKDLLQEFFTNHPEVGSIQWCQYTPYFNDGDSCIFSLHEIGFIPAKLYDDGELIDEEDLSIWDLTEEYSFVVPGSYWGSMILEKHPEEKWRLASLELSEAMQEVENLIEGNEDLMLAMFGDHVCVKLTKDEIIVEEYDHD